PGERYGRAGSGGKGGARPRHGVGLSGATRGSLQCSPCAHDFLLNSPVEPRESEAVDGESSSIHAGHCSTRFAARVAAARASSSVGVLGWLGVFSITRLLRFEDLTSGLILSKGTCCVIFALQVGSWIHGEPGHRRCAPLPWCADAVRIFLLAADGSPAPERQREEVDEPARPYTLEGTKSDPWVRGGFLFFVGQGDRIGVE